MNWYLILIGIASYILAFCLDEGYEHKQKTPAVEFWHKVYAVLGILSFLTIVLGAIL